MEQSHPCHHPDDQVIEFASLPHGGGDRGALYRLCQGCGRQETMRHGQFYQLEGQAVPVSYDAYHRAATQLGVDNLAQGAL